MLCSEWPSAPASAINTRLRTASGSSFSYTSSAPEGLWLRKASGSGIGYTSLAPDGLRLPNWLYMLGSALTPAPALDIQLRNTHHKSSFYPDENAHLAVSVARSWWPICIGILSESELSLCIQFWPITAGNWSGLLISPPHSANPGWCHELLGCSDRDKNKHKLIFSSTAKVIRNELKRTSMIRETT